MIRVGIFLLFPLPPSVTTVKSVHPFAIDPLIPICTVLVESVTGKNTIA